ncbi:hypothetical protein OE88DRAFT_1645506 [Heliocybe sulcata]|uniref:Uncharacterized protein n=1 Tax=Heliocybe sulcata TaxID=5364 RepID=A0A5C3MZI0_9AGAM|nr:hypothetical protein OE88DRAFT_1645506 [Heliocybe sulcata]
MAARSGATKGIVNVRRESMNNAKSNSGVWRTQTSNNGNREQQHSDERQQTVDAVGAYQKERGNAHSATSKSADGPCGGRAGARKAHTASELTRNLMDSTCKGTAEAAQHRRATPPLSGGYCHTAVMAEMSTRTHRDAADTLTLAQSVGICANSLEMRFRRPEPRRGVSPKEEVGRAGDASHGGSQNLMMEVVIDAYEHPEHAPRRAAEAMMGMTGGTLSGMVDLE